jgi:hypothetical protein
VKSIKATIQGIQIEGSLEEILAFKTATDQQAKDEHFIKPITVTIFNQHPAPSDASAIANAMRSELKKKNPFIK